MVGILYESNEWSDWKLRDELEAALQENVTMIDMESPDALETARTCDHLISRVFASAVFRGHVQAASNMIDLVKESIHTTSSTMPPLINPARAHLFEISKNNSTHTLKQGGIDVPHIQALGKPAELIDAVDTFDYPCIIKPDCGGRTTHTAVLHSEDEAKKFLSQAQEDTSTTDEMYIVEDYIEAREGFITRIEIVDSNIALIVKRSIEKNGLSSYHEGSTYELYPDCPHNVQKAAVQAAKLLDIQFGSFDIIESTDGRAYIIDANSVSNVSADCTELFGMDLMKEHAQAMANIIRTSRKGVFYAEH